MKHQERTEKKIRKILQDYRKERRWRRTKTEKGLGGNKGLIMSRRREGNTLNT